MCFHAILKHFELFLSVFVGFQVIFGDFQLKLLSFSLIFPQGGPRRANVKLFWPTALRDALETKIFKIFNLRFNLQGGPSRSDLQGGGSGPTYKGAPSRSDLQGGIVGRT